MGDDEIVVQHRRAMQRYDQLTGSRIVQSAVLVEAKLENIIAFHFCDDQDKWLAFKSFIFLDGEITFSKKIEICKKVFRQYYPAVYEQISPMFKRLHKVRELRNKFAHSKILVPHYNDPRLFMEYQRNGQIVQEPIDTPEHDVIIHEATGCHFFLGLILGELMRQKATGQAQGLLPNHLRFMRERCPSLLAQRYR
jgi:hypothetical protein